MANQTKKLSKTLVKKMDSLVTEVSNAQITSDDTYYQACNYLKSVQMMRKTITGHYKQIKDAINASRKTILNLEKADLGRIEPAEEKLVSIITAYEDGPATELPDGSTATLDPPKNQYRQETPRVVVRDKDALIAAISSGVAPSILVKPDQSELNKAARQLGKLFSIPGCHVEYDVKIITRSVGDEE
jgi:hypothetical protein